MRNTASEPILYQYRPLRAKNTLFLDRDGVLIQTVRRGDRTGSARNWSEVKLCSDIKALRGREIIDNFNLIVVTNQPDIANGLADYELLDKINNLINKTILVNAIYVCPHNDADNCKCRKPKPGMIRAFHMLQFRNNSPSLLGREYMIGDTERDYECAKIVDIPFILRRRAYNKPLMLLADMSINSLWALRKII